MYVYNADETDISIVHKPGRVVCELGHSNVYALISAEGEDAHSVIMCVSFWAYFAPSDGVSSQEECP